MSHTVQVVPAHEMQLDGQPPPVPPPVPADPLHVHVNEDPSLFCAHSPDARDVDSEPPTHAGASKYSVASTTEPTHEKTAPSSHVPVGSAKVGGDGTLHAESENCANVTVCPLVEPPPPPVVGQKQLR